MPARIQTPVPVLQFLADTRDGLKVGRCLTRLLPPNVAASTEVHAADPEGATLHVIAKYGANGANGVTGAEWNRFGAVVPARVPLPFTDVYRCGRTVTMPVKDAVEQWPLISTYANTLPYRDHGVLVCAPVWRAGYVMGTISWEFPRPLKNSSDSLLNEATAAVSLWMQARLAEHPLPAAAPTVVMTERQQLVLELIKDGHTNRAIAASTGYSVSTIRADITALGKLLNTTSREELVGTAHQLGLFNSHHPTTVAPGNDQTR